MSLSPRSVVASVLQLVAWASFGAAGLAYFFGGRAIHELIGTERVLAEFEGYAVAGLCAAVGVIANFGRRWLMEKELPSSLF